MQVYSANVMTHAIAWMDGGQSIQGELEPITPDMNDFQTIVLCYIM